MAKNAQPTDTDIAKPNTGIRQNTIVAPNDEIPDVNATNYHSIPQTANDTGLIANNTPNIDDIPLPPLKRNQIG